MLIVGCKSNSQLSEMTLVLLFKTQDKHLSSGRQREAGFQGNMCEDAVGELGVWEHGPELGEAVRLSGAALHEGAQDLRPVFSAVSSAEKWPRRGCGWRVFQEAVRGGWEGRVPLT